MLYFTKKRIIRDQIKSDCLAPFHSLRFEHSGKIIACCFNRGHVLGEFPQMSIKEAWFGEKINDLRKRLSKKDYSLGCQQCEIAVKNGNRINSGAAQYDYLKNYEQHRGYPTMFDFELGSTCNFECIMCSGEYSSAIRKNREKKSKYYAPYEEFSSDFIEQLIPFLPYLKEIRFLGGEPFLMKIYYDIWEKIIEVNPSILISVTTNASVLNSRVKEILSKSNIKVAVSIDSLIKERFEDIRKNGDFETVMSNTAYFHEHNKKLGHVMNFNLCVMRQNWDEIPKYYNYCNGKDIKVVLHTIKFPLHCAIWNLTSDDLANIITNYENKEIEGESIVSKENKSSFKGLINQIKSWYLEAKDRESLGNRIDTYRTEFKRKIKELENYDNYDENIDYFSFIEELTLEFPKTKIEYIYKHLGMIDTRLLIDEVNIGSKERLFQRVKLIVDNEI